MRVAYIGARLQAYADRSEVSIVSAATSYVSNENPVGK